MPEPTLIVLVEDEEHLAQGLIFNLEAEGYRVHHEADGTSAFDYLLHANESIGVILLDVMLPGRDGFEIARALREAKIYTPILMLTARNHPQDVLEGFASGADDYLNKPFDLAILLARVSGLLRRMRWQRAEHVHSETETEQANVYDFGNARCIHWDTLELHSKDTVIHLTLMEADLLRYLVERAGKIVSRKEILEEVWRVREDTDTRAIDNFIVRLRRYIEDDPAHPTHLLTVRGVGYRFMPA
ncbi:MAG: response regulator transcription factor [Acidobacteria bacterium]|nr:response regulator transcription factor [Acidobacteriota bacterium]